MKTFKRLTCISLIFFLCVSDIDLTFIGGVDLLKPMKAFAATATDAYDACSNLKDVLVTSTSASSKLMLNTPEKNTRVTTAGNSKAPDTSDYWKLKDSLYKNGLYNGFFTFQQKNIDAAAQVKAGDWLNSATYEAMAGTPTTEDVFVTMGGSQWIADLQYRVTECSYIRRYHFDSKARNYRYYKTGNISGRTLTHKWDKVRTPVGLPWDDSTVAERTLGNWRWKSLECGSNSTTAYGMGISSSYTNVGYFGNTPFRYWKKDKIYDSNKTNRYTTSINESMTPNKYACLYVKKQVAKMMQNFKKAFDGIQDNYRADQGMWDADKDGTNDHISWMYTYAGMIRKSATKSSNGGGTFTQPKIVSYFFDWDAYSNYGGVSSSTPSDTVQYKTLGQLGMNPNYIITYLSKSADISSWASNDIATYFPVQPGYGVAEALSSLDMRLTDFNVVDGNINKYSNYSIRELYAAYGISSSGTTFAYPPLLNFMTPEKFLAFGGPIDGTKGYFKLTEKQLGEKITKHRFETPSGVVYDFKTDGFSELGYWYYYTMYKSFLAYGWMFYSDEITELWAGLPGAVPKAGWDNEVDEILAFVFGNADFPTFSMLKGHWAKFANWTFNVPYAIFPRGGDMDGNIAGADTRERDAIRSLNVGEVFCPGLKVSNNNLVYYIRHEILIDSNTYDYPKHNYCIVIHANGDHCTIPNGKECSKEHHPCGMPLVSTQHHSTHSSSCGKLTCSGFSYNYGCAGDGVHYPGITSAGSSTCSCTKEVSAHPDGLDHGDKPCNCGTKPVPDPHSITYHTVASTDTGHSNHYHAHYDDADTSHQVLPANHDTHDPVYFEEDLTITVSYSVYVHRGAWCSAEPGMEYHKVIGQKFDNVQWLDVDSYQIWMINSGYSKGLAHLLSQPVTIDKGTSVIQTAVTSQLGYTHYNIDDAKADSGEKDPTSGKTVLSKVVDNLEYIGRVANSFNAYSLGNSKNEDYYTESFGGAWGAMGSSQLGTVLSYLPNDCPAILTATANTMESLSGAKAVGHVNGDFAAFKYVPSDKSNDDIYFYYNPYAQGGRSCSTFAGFINQALAHTLYYCTKGDAKTPHKKPTKNSTKVAYGNSIRIQGDYLALDFAYEGAAKTKQQPLVGYMYDTWREKDKSKYPDYSSGQFRLVKDVFTDHDTTLAKFNCRCTWVPGNLSYLGARAGWDIIVGSKDITEKSNSWIIHTFSRGINGDKHTCWDTIVGDVGGSECAFDKATEKGDVRMGKDCIQKPVNLDNLIPTVDSAPVTVNGVKCSVIKLKYFNNKTPYELIKEAFANGNPFYGSTDKKYYNIYAAINTQAPWIGYGADGYTSGGSHDGFHDISKNGAGDTQSGYKVLETSYNYDSQKTYVTKDNGYNGGFAQFGYWNNHPSAKQPVYENNARKNRGDVADGANSWSKYYPWLQHLNINRYLANDRYTTGRAAIKYESVGKYTDPHLSNAVAEVHTSNKTANPGMNKYFYEGPVHFFDDDWNYKADNQIYVNAAYSPGKLGTLEKGNFYGNPNDIVIYNPVSTQTAHIVTLSEFLPDGGNAGTVTNSAIDRDYTQAYLKSFGEYVSRDTRLVYKHNLDKELSGKDEQYISSTEVFKSELTETTTTTEDVINTVSSIPTEPYTMEDYEVVYDKGSSWYNTNFQGSYTVPSSGNYDMTIYQSSSSYLSGTAYLQEGDVVSLDSSKTAVFVDMTSPKLELTWSYVVNGYKALLLSNYVENSSDIVSSYGTALASKHADSTLASQTPDYQNNYQSALDEILRSMASTATFDTNGITGIITETFSGYGISINDAVVVDYYTTIADVLQKAGCNADFSKQVILKEGVSNLNTGGNSIRKGQVLHITMPLANGEKGNISVIDPNNSSLRVESFWNNNTYNIVIEALTDMTLPDIEVRIDNSSHLQKIGNLVSYDKTVLMAYGDTSSVITDKTSYDYWFGSTPISAQAHRVKLMNKTVMKSRSTASMSEFDTMTVGGFYISGGSASTVKLRADSRNNPHKVPNSYWKYYVLGWRTTDNHIITSINDPVLNKNDTRLWIPCGTYYISGPGFVTVQDLLNKVNSGLLGIYQDTEGDYGLIDLKSSNGKLTYEHYSAYTGYSITEGHFPLLDFTDGSGATTVYDTVLTADMCNDPNISEKAYESVFKCTNFSAICYDVAYSRNSAHKVTEESSNYYGDWKTVTSTNVIFTSDVYDSIFANALSLDDEFTIYWDNYADLYNSNGAEATQHNLSGTSTSLGKGWDNTKTDAHKNKGSGTNKNASKYSDWSIIKNYEYWKNASNLSKVTDTTKWIYNKYVVFNVDMFAFSEYKNFTYDDTKGPEEQEGSWDPTTPAYNSKGEPNKLVYIPAGTKVPLGYYLQRNTDDVIGTSDNSGRFVDYGYNYYIDENGKEKYSRPSDDYNVKGTKDPNGQYYTYHFWVPLSDGEAMETATATFVVNAINSVDDMDEDADKDREVDDRKACTDNTTTLSRTLGKVGLSGKETGYSYKSQPTTDDKANQTYSKGISKKMPIGKDEWNQDYIKAYGYKLLNNVNVLTSANFDGEDLKFSTRRQYRRYTGSVNSQTTSIVGRIGNFVVLDSGDPRFQDSFKLAMESDPYAISPVVRAITTYSNKMGERGSQDRYMSDTTDVRGRVVFADGASIDGKYKTATSGDTYTWNGYKSSESAAWYLSKQNIANHYNLNEWRDINKHEEVVADLQTVKVGYEFVCSIETIGNFYGSLGKRPTDAKDDYVNMNYDYGQTKVQVHPMYVAYNTKTGEKSAVDVYMRNGDTYACINAGSLYASKEQAPESDKGPYYLSTTYNNKYSVTLATNTAGESGDTYKLDQSMLRRSITSAEAKITHDVVKKLSQEKEAVQVKGGITTSILDQYDYSDISMVGGIALEPTYTYGNGQMLFLREFNRTFIGGTTLALNQAVPSGTFGKSVVRNSEMYAQRWHFNISLPSSSVFVRHGDKVREDTILNGNEGWYILCLVDIYAIGEKWAMHYTSDLSNAAIKLEDRQIPEGEWNVYHDKFPNAIPIGFHNIEKENSSIDLETRGSH